jgi:hypothetical protein
VFLRNAPELVLFYWTAQRYSVKHKTRATSESYHPTPVITSHKCDSIRYDRCIVIGSHKCDSIHCDKCIVIGYEHSRLCSSRSMRRDGSRSPCFRVRYYPLDRDNLHVLCLSNL